MMRDWEDRNVIPCFFDFICRECAANDQTSQSIGGFILSQERSVDFNVTGEPVGEVLKDLMASRITANQSDE